MTQSILEIVQDLAARAYLTVGSDVVNTQDSTAKHLLALAHLEGAELVSKADFPELVRLHTITLIDGQEQYALPVDFDRAVMRTFWDNSNTWRTSPVTPQTWRTLKTNLVNALVSKVQRFWSWDDNKIFIYPVPTSDDAGNTLSFEYLSNTWIRPQKWGEGTTYDSGARVWANGNIYTADSAGAAGATQPTHTTGSASDGSLSWTYLQNYGQTRFLQNTDVPLIDATLLSLGIRLRYERETEHDASDATREEYERRLNRKITALKDTEPFGFSGRYVTEGNIPILPDGNFSL